MIKSIVRRIKKQYTEKILRQKPFYCRYPYKGGIPINNADWRGVIDFELNFFYNRIPKAANSTITVKLAELKYGVRFSSWKAKNIFLRPSQISWEQMQRVNHLFKFTFVRNPYSRILSAYLDKIVCKKYHTTKSLHKLGSISEPSFLDFCCYLEDNGLYDNPHWAPQISILLMPPDHFDFIGKVETIERDMVFVLKKLNKPCKRETLSSAGPAPTHAGEKLEMYYENRCHDIVTKLYKEDFENFGYAL